MGKAKGKLPGDILREDFIEKYGLQQAKLAKKLNIPEISLSLIVRNKKRISMTIGLRLATYFGTEDDFFLIPQFYEDIAKTKEEMRGELEKIAPASGAKGSKRSAERVIKEGGTVRKIDGTAVKLAHGIPYINKLIEIILEVTEPEIIIVFGPYATGKIKKGSAVDLLVVKKKITNSTLLQDKIYSAKTGEGLDGVPANIRCVNRVQFRQLAYNDRGMYKKIWEEGLVVYED
jgi:addiction module HigA family antidote